MKRIRQISILSVMTALCLCVFPLCLVRKNADVYPTLNIAYENTDMDGQKLTQTFVAQTDYLSQIAFDITFSQGKPDSGNLVIVIQEESGNKRVIAQRTISLQDVKDSAFTLISVEKWIQKGKLYSYTVAAEEGTEVSFRAVYTVKEKDASAGNQTLYFDGKMVDGQAVTRYVYGFPLNIKNVICLWAFIWMTGMILMETFADWHFLEENKLISRAEALLTKWQYPVLLLEAVVILFMIIRICRNEAVHWDEAYTWQMVTKNSVGEMFRATAADVHPPLYYLLVMAAMKLFGENIFVAKMVSVAGAVATGILGITIVRKRWGIKTAIPFLMVDGLGTQMIYYNVDVRMYSWVVFFVLAAGLTAYEIMQSGRTLWWGAFTAVSLGGMYTQYFSVVPLAVIYLFLAVWIVTKDRTQIKKWIVCCVATAAGYLPWTAVVVDTLKRDAADRAVHKNMVTFRELIDWAFKNNIKFSEYMPVVLFVVVILCMAAGYKRYAPKEKAYRIFLGLLLPLSYGVCMLLMLVVNHFWDNRYLVDTLLFVWLFLLIFLAEKNLVTWGVGMIWLSVSVLSSYTVVQAAELNTVPWIQQTKQLLWQVQEEEKIVYTFPTYDVLYQYYVPDAEFIWYEDTDFLDWEDGEFYVIAWGENDFSWLLYQDKTLRKEILGSMRFEEGITAELWKIHFTE